MVADLRKGRSVGSIVTVLQYFGPYSIAGSASSRLWQRAV